VRLKHDAGAGEGQDQKKHKFRLPDQLDSSHASIVTCRSVEDRRCEGAPVCGLLSP
jgi:hypothetical protein